MARDRAYYSKKQIKDLISRGKVQLTEPARISAYEDFGWDIDDICAALLVLPIKDWYKSQTRFDNPHIWVDYYRSYDLKGENVYTHFYVDSGCMVIDSFKDISK